MAARSLLTNFPPLRAHYDGLSVRLSVCTSSTNEGTARLAVAETAAICDANLAKSRSIRLRHNRQAVTLYHQCY
jgi:hypothetical protein